MGWSRPIQHNLNINNPGLSFELSTLAYFRYLIKVFTLLVSVFALDTNKLSIESPCQPWHRQHSPHGHRCHGCRPCQRSHWSLSPCHRVSNVNPSINVSVYFAKDRHQDYNLGAKTFNSVNIFMVSKRSCKFFIASQSQAFSKFSPALINTIRVFLSRRGLTGLMSPGPVWTTLMLLRRERESKLGVITLTASRARTLATWTPQVIKKGLPDIYCRH